MHFRIRTKPINPLNQALQLLEAAGAIIRQHKKITRLKITEADFDTLSLMSHQLNAVSIDLTYLRRALRKHDAPDHQTE